MTHYGRNFFDRCLATVISELARHEEQYPEWPDDAASAARIVLKNAQGLVEAATENGRGSVDDDGEIIEHAVQTGAMALRFLLNTGNAGGRLQQMSGLQECLAVDPYEGRY